MNLYEEELRALRASIEQINYMLKQPHYKDIENLLLVRKEQYYQELRRMIE